MTRYIFPAFDIDDLNISFLGNTPEGTDFREMRDRLLTSGMSHILLPNGYLHFANPLDGRMFDPLCFDTKRTNEHGDCPIVRIDHEAILGYNESSIVEEIAPSFEGLVERIIQGVI